MKEIQILNNGDALYDIRRKINENFELVHEKATTEPLVSFGVNEGNETDGVADLLNIDGDTLNFKVGGEYPNLVMTSGDGVTTKIENVNPLHLQNLADGEYTVLVDGSNSTITDAEFYSQLLEPENVNEGDVWFNGESAYEKKNSQPMLEELASTGLTLNTLTKLDNYYLAISSNNTLYTSEDDGVTWTARTIAPSGNAAYIGCVAFKNAFFLLTSDRQLYRINKAWQLERITSIYNGDSVVPTKLLVQNDILFAFAGGKSIYYTTTNENYWTATGIPEATIPRDIVFVDGKYYLFDNSGKIFTSTNLTDWTATQHTIQTPSCAKLYGDNILIGCVNGYLLVFNLQSDTIRQITPLKQDATITDIDILADGGVLIVGHKGICAVSYDLQNFTQLLQRDNLITATEGNFIVGSSGIHCKLVLQSTWVPYTYIPVGEVTISGGEVTYFTTYPYNTNGLFEATSSTFGLLRTAAEPDELNCHCQEAVLTPANLYNLNNYRTMNTSYEVGDKVGCPYHHNLQLRCTQTGTTSNEVLDTKGTLQSGQTITDGSVKWKVEELITDAGTANIDLSNLSTTGQAKFDEKANVVDVLDKSQITNCILEIPQKINYTLSNGTLTIKAGSKVIVPNGANKFDEITVSKDVSCSIANSDKNMLFIRGGNTYIARPLSSQTGSGTTNPTNGYHGFYNTTDNIVYNILDGVTQDSGLLSLPVLVFTSDDTGVVSVDEVFNGFGYIGSTLFCDKGIKVLIPNGKNVNGSLKNIEYTTPKVITGTLKDARSNTNFCLHNNGTLALRTGLKYNENSNYNYMDAVGNIYGMPFAIGTTTTNGVITEYKSLTNAVCLADANKTVSKLGDTMTGDLKIKNPNSTTWQGIEVTGNHIDTTLTTQTSLGGGRLITYDKNNKIIGYVQTGIGSAGNVYTALEARRVIDGANVSCIISASVGKDGKPFTVAPTPATGDNSTKIATTAWVNNEKETISSWGFPSTKYTNLTLGESGTTYTAPANGWFTLAKTNSQNAEAYIAMNNTTAGQLQIECRQMKHYTGTEEPWARVFIPASKGDVVRVDYDVDGETKLFRFIYAKGAE